jgi:ribokinase
MIVVFGSINVDFTIPAPAIPRAGETVLAARYDKWFGGKGANQAVAAARARLDAALPVLMVGAVGNDDLGREAVSNLRAAGVDTGHVAVAGLPTGCAFITVDPAGENAITVAAGSNAAVRAEQVPDAVLRSATLLMLQMEVPHAENARIARRAKALGVKVWLNLAPVPASIGNERMVVDDLLAVSDVLIVNEHEMVALERMTLGLETDTPENAASRLARNRRLTVVVTLGALGAVTLTPDGTAIRAASPPIQPVDTTGAGDTFAGILASGIAGNLPFAQALDRACRGAAMACLHAGAQPGMPTSAQLE